MILTFIHKSYHNTSQRRRKLVCSEGAKLIDDTLVNLKHFTSNTIHIILV